jgi:hypothetical protein
MMEIWDGLFFLRRKSPNRGVIIEGFVFSILENYE